MASGKTFLYAALIVMAPPLPARAQTASDPQAIVRALIARDRDANLIVALPVRPNDYMRKVFTQAFNASWANAMSHNNDEPVFDGDFITGYQTVTRVLLKSAATAENGDFAMVSTNIVYFNDEGPRKPHAETVRFFLKKEVGSWKIDDIHSGEQESIRTNFKKSYGK
jgi:hypothetical protein